MNKRNFIMTIVATVVMFVAAVGMPAFGQNSNSNMNSNSDMSGNMNSNMKMDKKDKSNKNGSMNSNMGGGSMMPSAADKKFMMTAAQGGMAEVAMARVALDKASSDSVKQYAQKMIDDHTAANTELMQIASTKGVTLPTAPDAKHQAMMTKMQAMSGAAFDAAYIKNSGVMDHKNMEKLFMGESSKGMDADVKGFAAKTLPTVQMHLKMAQDMSTSMMSMKGKSSMGNGNSNSKP